MTKAEEFIREHTRNCSNTFTKDLDSPKPRIDCYPWLTPDQARKAVEIAREEMIERACKWLQCKYRVIGGGEVEDFIWSLKQAMKDENKNL